jgi:two-component system, response regulator
MDNAKDNTPTTIQIMLIEDDFDHAELTKRILNSLQQKVNLIHIKNGEKALDYLKSKCKSAKKPQIDLILLDLRLPGIDGIDILRSLKQNKKTKNITVAILSTSGFNHDRNLAKKHKADFYLVKPLNQNELIKILDDQK